MLLAIDYEIAIGKEMGLLGVAFPILKGNLFEIVHFSLSTSLLGGKLMVYELNQTYQSNID